MQIRRYSGVAVAIHWLVALLIIFNVALAWIWPVLPDEKIRPAIEWHKSIGILVLGLAIMRLLWRMTHKPPLMPTTFQKWEITLSSITHVLLYLIIFAMPLSGWIMDSAWERAAQNPVPFLGGLFEWPRIGFIMNMDPDTKKWVHDVFGAMHGVAAKILYVLFFLHVGGALKHQLIDRQPELQRMWFGKDKP